MSIYNPYIKKSPLAVAPTWAKLVTVDNKLEFNFLVNPTIIRWQHNVNLSTLNVLRSSQPLVRYQYSTSVLTIPVFYLWTHNNSATIANEIANLKQMTKPVIVGGIPSLLTLTWGELKETRLVLSSLEIEEKQWRSGQPTQAEGSMSFVYSPAQVTPVPVKATVKTTPRVAAKDTKTVTKTAPKTTVNSKGNIINKK